MAFAGSVNTNFVLSTGHRPRDTCGENDLPLLEAGCVRALSVTCCTVRTTLAGRAARIRTASPEVLLSFRRAARHQKSTPLEAPKSAGPAGPAAPERQERAGGMPEGTSPQREIALRVERQAGSTRSGCGTP